MDPDTTRFVVITVHGTFGKFGRKAPWIYPKSLLSGYLTGTLPNAHIEPFEWSGANSVSARAIAAGDLADRIEKLRQRFKTAHLAIVAHSHGGNVALMALSSKTLAQQILGVVTLGTPFLHAEMRKDEGPLGVIEALFAAAFCGVAVFACGAALGHGRSWWLYGAGVTAVIAASVGLAELLAIRMRRYATRLRTEMPSTAATQDQVCIVRTSSDEAAAVLSGARVAGALVTLFWHGVSGPVVKRLRGVLERIDYGGARAVDRTYTSWIEERRTTFAELSDDSKTPFTPRPLLETVLASPLATKREWPSVMPPMTYATPVTEESPLKAWVSIAHYFPALVMTMLEDANTWTRWFGAICAVAYGAPAIVALLFSVLSIPFGIALSIGLLPGGWTLPLAGPYLDIAAEPAPPGTWKVTQLGPENTGDALSHGKAHDDSRVFTEVANWILDRAAVVDKRNRNAT